jgi:hypothetical protein
MDGFPFAAVVAIVACAVGSVIGVIKLQEQLDEVIRLLREGNERLQDVAENVDRINDRQWQQAGERLAKQYPRYFDD